eukprot:3052062-Pyramimonas_sp.AAC.2
MQVDSMLGVKAWTAEWAQVNSQGGQLPTFVDFQGGVAKNIKGRTLKDGIDWFGVFAAERSAPVVVTVVYTSTRFSRGNASHGKASQQPSSL